jgi:hypothetical protein
VRRRLRLEAVGCGGASATSALEPPVSERGYDSADFLERPQTFAAKRRFNRLPRRPQERQQRGASHRVQARVHGFRSRVSPERIAQATHTGYFFEWLCPEELFWSLLGARCAERAKRATRTAMPRGNRARSRSRAHARSV